METCDLALPEGGHRLERGQGVRLTPTGSWYPEHSPSGVSRCPTPTLFPLFPAFAHCASPAWGTFPWPTHLAGMSTPGILWDSAHRALLISFPDLPSPEEGSLTPALSSSGAFPAAPQSFPPSESCDQNGSQQGDPQHLWHLTRWAQRGLPPVRLLLLCSCLSCRTQADVAKGSSRGVSGPSRDQSLPFSSPQAVHFIRVCTLREGQGRKHEETWLPGACTAGWVLC